MIFKEPPQGEMCVLEGHPRVPRSIGCECSCWLEKRPRKKVKKVKKVSVGDGHPPKQIGLEMEWHKTRAPARGVFPFYEPHFPALDADLTRKEAELCKMSLE